MVIEKELGKRKIEIVAPEECPNCHYCRLVDTISLEKCCYLDEKEPIRVYRFNKCQHYKQHECFERDGVSKWVW